MQFRYDILALAMLSCSVSCIRSSSRMVSGNGEGFGGGDENISYLTTAQNAINETLSLYSQTKDPSFCQAVACEGIDATACALVKSAHPDQVSYIQNFVQSYASQIVAENSGPNKIQFLIQDEAFSVTNAAGYSVGVNMKTKIGPDGPVYVKSAFLKGVTFAGLMSTVSHELHHKIQVVKDGSSSYIGDVDPWPHFDVPDGSRLFLDTLSSCIALYAVKNQDQLKDVQALLKKTAPSDIGEHNKWYPISTVGAPTPRFGHSAVWTGSKMIVWGGFQSNWSNPTNTGAIYDVATDTWTPTSTLNAPTPRGFHGAVWTGTRMVVAGGSGGTFSGSYDPATDTWASGYRYDVPFVSAVSTGTTGIFWGGEYNPQNVLNQAIVLGADAMGQIPLDGTEPGTPQARAWHSAVWTGSKMIVWGGTGANSTPLNDGGSLDPSCFVQSCDLLGCGWTLSGGCQLWQPTSTVGAPSPRAQHSAVWTGTKMIIWGGTGAGGTGAQYEPVSAAWTPTTQTNALSSRYYQAGTWNGTNMLIWGGTNGRNLFNDGALYDPSVDVWFPIATQNAPQARAAHTMIWTGTKFIVWGGFVDNSLTLTNTGGMYLP